MDMEKIEVQECFCFRALVEARLLRQRRRAEAPPNPVLSAPVLWFAVPRTTHAATSDKKPSNAASFALTHPLEHRYLGSQNPRSWLNTSGADTVLFRYTSSLEAQLNPIPHTSGKPDEISCRVLLVLSHTAITESGVSSIYTWWPVSLFRSEWFAALCTRVIFSNNGPLKEVFHTLIFAIFVLSWIAMTNEPQNHCWARGSSNMSHEAISYLWSALYDLSSLSAGLRDTVGNFILQACRSEYHPLDTPQRFLEYALELGVTFDVIRCINKADHQASSLLQDDLISSVAHFLIHTANDFGTSQSLLTDAAYIQVLGQTICSAVFSLQDCAWNCRSELRSVLYRAAKRLLTNAPSTDIRLWYVQTLAHYLCSHYGPDPSVHASLDQSNIDWKMLWEAVSRQFVLYDLIWFLITEFRTKSNFNSRACRSCYR